VAERLDGKSVVIPAFGVTDREFGNSVTELDLNRGVTDREVGSSPPSAILVKLLILDCFRLNCPCGPGVWEREDADNTLGVTDLLDGSTTARKSE
jgi:hypothetical protein